ncbi:MAG: ATP-dependent helicase, partial [Chitinophagaceae bacterium]|nr:ATP-dependent helicase [Chitinophagaceae bacterium]
YLLQHYQERFQYILVDEFQDTNGAQNEILNLLTNFWGDAANIFVVGDDDQSIYEFQGARIKNIVDFYEKYESEIKVLVLNQNYRSSKAVLEKAMLSIDNNKQRLINSLSKLALTKNIESALPRFQNEAVVAPIITSYEHPIHEAVAIAHQLEGLQKSGVSLDNVAIIYAQHRQANYLIQLLERKGIPFTLRKSINVLHEVLVQQLLRIFTYLSQESTRAFSGEPLLFQLMHSPYFGIAPQDIAQLSIYINSKEAKDKQIKHWRQLFAHEMLLSSMELPSLKQILKLARALDYWMQQLQVLRLPMLLEKIVHDSQIVDWCLKGNNANWDTQVLTSFFEFVKNIATKETTIDDLLAIVARMDSEGIELPLMRIVQQKNGVQLYTAHSAKGLEFEHVFVIGCTSDFWEKKSGNTGTIKLPDTLTRTVDEQDNDYKIEVARRLFYVAITRAKKHLQISYPRQKQDGKQLTESVFITEILNGDMVAAQEVTDQIYADVQVLLQPVTDGYIALVDRSIMEQQLEQFAISASSLSKYLTCPISFYYENVLRIPVAENDTMAFGTAVHYALERAFKEMQKSTDKSFPPIADVLGFFRYKMQGKEIAFTELQYERRLQKGVELLTQYYTDNVATWQRDVQLEAMLQTTIQKVPIKGRIDKIELLAENQCRVVDYKTGNPDQKHTKENLAAPNEANDFKGGNYWRQMVFYKLLIEGQPFNKLQVGEGIFEYLEQNKAGTYTHRIIILPQDEETVKAQIINTYDRIKRFEFDKGCQDPDCKWCNFVAEHNILITK